MNLKDIPTYVESFHNTSQMHKLRYVQLGKTDMIVSHVGIGGCSAGGVYGSVEEQESVNTIVESIKSGINFIDTSPAYGSGRSEEVIGKALKQLPRQSYYIATKVGRYGIDLTLGNCFDFSAESVLKGFEKSLQKLGIDYVDLIQVHDLEFADNLDTIVNETLPALQKLVKQGKARYIGITGYPLSVLKEVVQRSTVTINTVLSYTRLTLQNQELNQYIPYFQSKGIGLINASITVMRLLTDQGPSDRHPAPIPIKDVAKQANELCKNHGMNISRLAVQFSTGHASVAVHLLGCDTVDIVRHNIEASTTPPLYEEKLVIEQIIKMFANIEEQHWEGVEIAAYKKVQERYKTRD